MNVSLQQVIPAIVSYVVGRGGFITKTKLLKLLYLFDVEYYRIHRKTFTGFHWKFFHLGPWAKEYDPLLDDLVTKGILVESLSSRSEFETKFYRTSESFDISGFFTDYKDEAVLKFVLDTWGDIPTSEILDYVYFRTEPMEQGIRNELLDFNTIQQELPPRYNRPSSGKTRVEIEALRRKFREKTSQPRSVEASTFHFTPPRYDAEFFEALAKLEESDR